MSDRLPFGRRKQIVGGVICWIQLCMQNISSSSFSLPNPLPTSHFSFTLLSPSQKRKRVPSPVGRPLQRMLAPTSQSLFFLSLPAPPLPQMAWKRYGCYEAACNHCWNRYTHLPLYAHSHLHTSLCPQTHTYTLPALCTPLILNTPPSTPTLTHTHTHSHTHTHTASGLGPQYWYPWAECCWRGRPR